MKPAIGFVADDGTFFTSAQDAELYEAIKELSKAATDNKIDPMKLINAVDLCEDEIRRYIDAKKANDRTKPPEFQTAEEAAHGVSHEDWNKSTGWGQLVGKYIDDKPDTSTLYFTDDAGTAEDIPPILQFASRRDEPMPDVGSGVSAEEVRDDSTIDGVGSGRSDAPSIRGDPDMATALPTGTAEARFIRGE